MSEWYRHGRAVSTIPIGDRAMLYGDGVFETIAVRNGAPRLWDLHAERLRVACERLDLRLPAPAMVERDLELALAQSTLGTRSVTAKLVLTAGSGPRGYRRPEAGNTDLYVGISASAFLDGEAYRDGVTTRICDTRISVQPRLAGIKTLNRLDQVLARQEWSSQEPWEGLMLDVDGHVICGTMSNVFLVHDNRISTPRLDRAGVAGIMRRHVIVLLDAESVAVEEKRLTTADLDTADEIFLTNSQIGAVPVSRIDERALKPGCETRRVMRMLAENGVPECAP